MNVKPRTALLAASDGAPPILIYRGDPAIAARPAVAVVGARLEAEAVRRLHAAGTIDEQHPFEMVELVLNGARHQTLGFDFVVLPVEIGRAADHGADFFSRLSARDNVSDVAWFQ